MALLAFLLLLGSAPAVDPATDATVTAPALKAAFLYNFAKFAEWPAEVLSGPLTICVLGDPAVADALEETVRGRSIDGRGLVLARVNVGGLHQCQLLYISGLDAKRSAQVLDEVRGAAVFTVGDRGGFAESGGIAGFFVEGAKMRFAINVDAAQRARLRISSRLLSLAKLVKDDHAQP